MGFLPLSPPPPPPMANFVSDHLKEHKKDQAGVTAQQRAVHVAGNARSQAVKPHEQRALLILTTKRHGDGNAKIPCDDILDDRPHAMKSPRTQAGDGGGDGDGDGCGGEEVKQVNGKKAETEAPLSWKRFAEPKGLVGDLSSDQSTLDTQTSDLRLL